MTPLATATAVPLEARSRPSPGEPLRVYGSDVFRRQDLWTVLQRILPFCRRVDGHPYVFTYDVVYQADRLIPDLIPSEVVTLWELADTEFTWLKGRPEEAWKLKDAGRVLRKVRASKEKARMAHAQRNKGLATGYELWLALEQSASLTSLSGALGWRLSKTLKALRRLESQGFVARIGKTWSRAGEEPPPVREPLSSPPYMSRTRPVRKVSYYTSDSLLS